MNRCPTCGTGYPAEARFCTRDGSRLVPRATLNIASAPREASNARAESPVPVTHATLVGQTLDGRYAVERKIGQGGMSFVYLATDIVSNERYAIKVLSTALCHDQNAMARLKREATLGMRLAHPNVCHIIRLGETQDGLVYVVMPFVKGEILSDRNIRMGTLALDEVGRFVRDIAAGLHVAHELGIVHRDLKPENVMICTDAGGTERAVVMDFGLAKERHADAELQKLTATGIILGTPEFMSPEQLRGKPLDARTDVYSLALMTFEMLTGELPFTGRTQQETMIARLRDDPPPLRQAGQPGTFPEAVERVLLKAMSRDPDGRYASAPAFATAFQQAVAGRASEPGVFSRMFRR
ncbi:MAG: serine/threonine protein kinase [Gemmatimonadaceae bacterium]|nr:serine/threonine protein kinase [Gemmatimonadaceae bacterium]